MAIWAHFAHPSHVLVERKTNKNHTIFWSEEESAVIIRAARGWLCRHRVVKLDSSVDVTH